jgi:hypothetical protein
MRHNDVRICATRNKASGWVRIRYMLVCVPACKVRCCIGCHSAVASSARRYYHYYSLRTAQQISLSQRDDVTPSRYTACSGTVSLPWRLDYCTHKQAWAAYTADIPTVPRCSRGLLW